MKNLLLFSLFITLFLSCQTTQKPETDTATPAIEDTTTHTNTDAPPASDRLKVTAGTYSKPFMAAIREDSSMTFSTIELLDGIMIVDEMDSIPFPATPELGKKYVLRGQKDNLAIDLYVERINYSSILYRIEIEKEGEEKNTLEGAADINHLFYLGSESDVIDGTDESYFVTEFFDANEDCYTYIRIGEKENKSDAPLLAKIILDCGKSSASIALDNCPTLQGK